MRIIKKFGSFLIKEGSETSEYRYKELTGEITLYRLTSHSVVDLSAPGEYYVCDSSAIDPELLDKQGGEMFLLTVKCDASNIDQEASEKECGEKGNPYIVGIKDDTKCRVVGVVPYEG